MKQEKSDDFKEVRVKKEETDVTAAKLDIKSISALVVTELTILYKSGVFSNKELFKKLAKKLTHFILYRNFTNTSSALDEIKRIITKLGNRKISAEIDFEHIFE